MALDKSKQVLANLIQAYDVIIANARSGYSDSDSTLKDFLVNESLRAQSKSYECKKKLIGFDRLTSQADTKM